MAAASNGDGARGEQETQLASGAERAVDRYGVSGEIERGDLPVGLAGLVSDEALTMASLNAFEIARSTWAGERDFVDHVDYQLSLRQALGFNREPNHIASLMMEKRRRGVGWDRFGLFFSADEDAELTRRDELRAQLPQIRSALTNGEFRKLREGEELLQAGLPPEADRLVSTHFDVDSATLLIHVADLDSDVAHRALEGIVQGGEYELVGTPYTASEFERYRQILQRDLSGLRVGYSIRLDPTTEGIRLLVTLESGDSLPRGFTTEVPADAFAISEFAEQTSLAHDNSDHGWWQLTAGQTIRVTSEADHPWCTGKSRLVV